MKRREGADAESRSFPRGIRGSCFSTVPRPVAAAAPPSHYTSCYFSLLEFFYRRCAHRLRFEPHLLALLLRVGVLELVRGRFVLPHLEVSLLRHLLVLHSVFVAHREHHLTTSSFSARGCALCTSSAPREVPPY